MNTDTNNETPTRVMFYKKEPSLIPPSPTKKNSIAVGIPIFEDVNEDSQLCNRKENLQTERAKSSSENFDTFPTSHVAPTGPEILEKVKPFARRLSKIKCFLVFFLILTLILIPTSVWMSLPKEKKNMDSLEVKSLKEMQKRDPAFEEFANSIKNETLREIMTGPSYRQVLANEVENITRWFPLNESVSYLITSKGSSDIKAGSNNTGGNNETYYNIQFINIESKNDSITLYLLINPDNTTYDLDSFLANGTDSKENNSSAEEEIPELDPNSEANNDFKFNLIKCQISRTGKVYYCDVPISLERNFISIAFNALSQYLPNLEKKYMKISVKKEESVNGRLLIEETSYKDPSDEYTFAGLGGEPVKKDMNLELVNDGKGNEGNMTMQLNTASNQSSLGGDVKLDTETEGLNLQTKSSIDPYSAVPKSSETQGNMALSSNKNTTIDGEPLKNDDYIFDGVNVDFQVSIQQNETKTLGNGQIDIIFAFEKSISFKKIMNPLFNQTFDEKNETISKEDSAQGTNFTRRLLASKDQVVLEYNHNLFKKNIIGINIKGYIEAVCTKKDICLVLGTIDVAGIFIFPFYQTMFKVPLISKLDKFKFAKFYSASQILAATDVLINCIKQIKESYDYFINFNKEYINLIIVPYEIFIQKYNNIYGLLSDNFANFGEFISNTVILTENELYDNLEDVKLLAQDYEISMNIFLDCIQKEIKIYEQEICSNSNKLKLALDMIPTIKSNFNSLFESTLGKLNEMIGQGAFRKLFDSIDDIFNRNTISYPEESKELIKQIIYKKIDPLKKQWSEIFDKEFNHIYTICHLKWVEAHDQLEATLLLYESHLRNGCSASNVLPNSFSFAGDINILIDEPTLSGINQSSNLKMNRMLDKIINTINGLISDGIKKTYEGIKIAILGIQQNFTSIYEDLKQNIKDTKTNVSKIVEKDYEYLKSVASENFVSLGNSYDKVVKIISNLLNPDYQPTPIDLEKLVKELFKVPELLKSVFSKFKDARKNFEDFLGFFKDLISGKRVLSSLQKKEKRQLSSFNIDVFNPSINKLESKIRELKSAFSIAKKSAENLGTSLSSSITISNYDFDVLSSEFFNFFQELKTKFLNTIQSDLINLGQPLLLTKINDFLRFETIIDVFLENLFPKVEIDVIKPLVYDKTFEKLLCRIPFFLGTVNVNAFFQIYAELKVVFILNLGEVILKILPRARLTIGVTLACEILFFFRIGMFAAVDLFKGFLPMVFGFKIFKLDFFVRISISVEALTFRTGAYFQYLMIKFMWICWRIRIWIFRFNICLPIIYFAWSEWKVMFEFQIAAFKFEYVIVDKTFSLD